jgi:hypothetical protein
MAAFERSYAVNRLDEVSIGPGTFVVRPRKTQLSIRRITSVLDGGRFGVVKQYLEAAHKKEMLLGSDASALLRSSRKMSARDQLSFCAKVCRCARKARCTRLR